MSSAKSRICNKALFFFLLTSTALRAQVAVYNYPASSSTGVNAKTTIGVRYNQNLVKSTLSANSFAVIGVQSGKHSGTITLALDNRTVIFTPAKFFTAGEKVTVAISLLKMTNGKLTAPYSFYFIIAKAKTGINSLAAMQSPPPPQERFAIRTLGRDTIYDDFPSIYITKSNNPSPGNIYLDNFRYTTYGNDSGAYLITIDNAGNLLYAHSMWGRFAQDFRPQPNGKYTYFDTDPYKFKFYGMDSNFVVRDSFEAGNGYLTDDHELIFLPGGGYALLAQTDEVADLSKIINGGDSTTEVAYGIIQEFDSAKNLIFEWRTNDYIQLTDPTFENLLFPFLDLTHCNSLDFNSDTTFILSSRNLDEVTKVNRVNGKIIWRWGGKHNEFTFVDDSLVFSHQHAVKYLPDGNIVMFDNGDFHNTALPQSRAVEYRLDEDRKIATKVWEYHHDPDVYGGFMGYVQQLKSGNRLICWGSCDSVAVTEITPDKKTALEIRFDPGIYTYRAYKFTDAEVNQMIFGKTSAVTSSVLPGISLEQNYPNPATVSTTIEFYVQAHGDVRLTLFDALGRSVKTLFNGPVDPGKYTSHLSTADIPSGTYFYKIETPSGSLVKMMEIVK